MDWINLYRNDSLVQMDEYETESGNAHGLIETVRYKWAFLREKGFVASAPIEILRTGGGKTTIINLIARFYDPVSGTVSIDGTDIKRFTIRSLRDQISFVLQDTLLFHAPIWLHVTPTF